MRLGPALAIICALVLSGSVLAVELLGARKAGSYVWSINAPWFGGFSGIEMSDDGGAMIALTDRAMLVHADIERDDGQIADIQITSAHQVRSSKDAALTGRAADSEGLALAPGGGHYISFEGIHRVARFADPDARSKVLPRPDAFRNLALNGSFEALAIDDHGQLYTMPESSRASDGSIPVYRWDGHRWQTAFKLQQRGDYLPVGADFGPDGRLYVLERATRTLGFRSRLRRWSIANGMAGAEETVLETSTGTHENLEGVSIWRDADGQLRATMISDDNFLFILRTQIVEYLLPE